MDWLVYPSMVLMAYLVGSLPTGYLLARAKGIDIRAIGSGNIGATNVFRALGIPAGIFVLVIDGTKGFAACTWCADLVLDVFGTRLVDTDLQRIERVIAGIAVVLGHNFTCWLRFKGGKGIATSAGVYFALAPLSAAIALGSWLVVFVISRYVSLASIAAAVALSTAVWVSPNSLILRIVTTALCLLAIWKHKANIERLLNGTEKRVGAKRALQEAAP